jgi:hypothetical protein
VPRRPECQSINDSANPRGWTAHEAIDIGRLVAGELLLLGGHQFHVTRMNFVTYGSVTGDPRAGQDFAAGLGQVDLTLTHAQWKGCPAVEPVGRRMPQAWQEALADLRDAALRILDHPDTCARDAAFLRAQLAPLVDLVP